MEIQETGLAYVMQRGDLYQLHKELQQLFGQHPDWGHYADRPQLPVLTHIYDDLHRRGFGTDGPVLEPMHRVDPLTSPSFTPGVS